MTEFAQLHSLKVLTTTEARVLTEEVKRDAASLWTKMLRLYEGGAHEVLGYSSWGDYCEAEFSIGADRSYQLLQAGRVIAAMSTTDNCRLGTPANEAQARELAPLLNQPEVLRETWAEVVELHEKPTAADVREVVARRTGEPRPAMLVHYSSETDQWSTPADLFDLLDREFQFDLDPCATFVNAKCERYFTPAQDGLAQEWTGSVFMNPPYGDEIRAWVEKAWQSAGAEATVVVCLVPARVDTGWWWDYCRFGEVRFLRGRLRFGGGDTGAPFPSAVVIFGRPAAVKWWEREAA